MSKIIYSTANKICCKLCNLYHIVIFEIQPLTNVLLRFTVFCSSKELLCKITKSIKIQYLCYIIEMVYRISENNTLLWYKQTCHIIAYKICNQRRSVISAYLLIIEAPKINTYVEIRKWIETIKRFQWHNYEVCYKYLQSI